MTFLQPLFLVLTPLVLAPLVFFLLGPRIRKEIPFSWVRLLSGDPREGRRGRRTRDWFLVILRMAVLLALILAMSRPVWMGGTSPRAVAVDATWSMTPHWSRIRSALQEVEGVVPVVALNPRRHAGLPPRPWGTLKRFPPEGSLWITDGQHSLPDSALAGVVRLPRPCNRGVRILQWPLAVLPGRPYTVDLLVYSTCEPDPIPLELPEGSLRVRDTVRLTVEGCLDVRVPVRDPYPTDNRMHLCPTVQDPVTVAFLYDRPETLLVHRLLALWPHLFRRTSAEEAEVWIVIGVPPSLPYARLTRHRGVWFSDTLPVDLPPGWLHIPVFPDDRGGPRFLAQPDRVWRFYETLLGGGTVQIVEEGYRLLLPAGSRITPRPPSLRVRGDSLEVTFYPAGIYRITGPLTRTVVVQPPLAEVLVSPSSVREGRLPLPLTRPLVLLALALLLLEGLWVWRWR